MPHLTASEGAYQKLTVERPLVRHVIYQQYPHCSSIVCCGDGAKSLLACRVPDLKFDALAIQLDCSDFKVDSYCGDERGREGIFAESEEAA